MIKLFKLTDRDGQTQGGTQWGPCVSHSGTGEGGLCGPGWIHAYEHPLIAVLINPIHANFTNPRLWEAEGEIAIRDGQLKCGCKTLTTVREIPLPAITTEMRVRFAILCAKDVCACSAWNAWADKWLSGKDRSAAAAGAAHDAASWAAAAGAAYDAAASAAWAAARAAEAARDLDAIAAAMAASAAMDVGHRIDFFAIAEKACSGLRNKAGISKTVGSRLNKEKRKMTIPTRTPPPTADRQTVLNMAPRQAPTAPVAWSKPHEIGKRVLLYGVG